MRMREGLEGVEWLGMQKATAIFFLYVYLIINLILIKLKTRSTVKPQLQPQTRS